MNKNKLKIFVTSKEDSSKRISLTTVGELSKDTANIKSKIKNSYLNSNVNDENMSEGIGFKSLQNAHVEGGKIDNYELCKSCYIVDSRASKIWRNIITKILFKYPNKDSDFYQKFFNEARVFLKNVN